MGARARWYLRSFPALVLASGCARQPERVFVPGAPFRHVVEVSTGPGASATVRVNEWVALSGRRETGPWVAVDRRSLAPDGCWVAPAPPPVEAEVGDGLHWTAEPGGAAEFNAGFREDHTRLVRFSTPGRYALRASSATFCGPPAESNTLTVLVTE